MKPWFVKDTAFSARLTGKEMDLFNQVCPKRFYKKKETLFYMGDAASALHIIVEGQIKLTTTTADGRERILAICGPNDFIGEMFLSEAEIYHFDAVALTDTVSCPVSREQFMQLMVKVPNAICIFTSILAGRLFHCHQQLISLSNPVGLRVTAVLAEQARRFGSASKNGWVELTTELTHGDIAASISATRVSVSITFADLRERGLIEGTRGRYLVNLPALESLTGEA